MIRQFPSRPLCLLSALFLCLGARAAHAQSQQTQADAHQVLNFAVFTHGDVAFKRKGWMKFVPMAFGTSLQPGDILKVGEQSGLKVVCSDLTLHEVANGLSGIPCPAASGILHTPDGSLIEPTRGWLADGSYPMILSPRRTRLLSALPALRWTPVEGAGRYTVIVRTYNLSWQADVSSVTEIAYPPTAPGLKPGIDYKLIVQAGNRSSEAEPGKGLGFSILGAAERRTVEQEQHKIEALGLPPGPTLFLTAYLYRAYDLESEAIVKLEAASQAMKEPAVIRLLADCYLSVRLVRKAEEAYLKSLQLAGADEVSQAETHFKLGDTIYRQLLGNPKAAAAHLNAALALARRVGDEETANRASQALAMLSPDV